MKYFLRKKFLAVKRSVSNDDRDWFQERLAVGQVERIPLLIPEEEVVVTLPAATVEMVTMSEEFLKATEKVAIACSQLAVSDDKKSCR